MPTTPDEPLRTLEDLAAGNLQDDALGAQAETCLASLRTAYRADPSWSLF